MMPAGRCATAALGILLRDQPLSPGKVSLAWRTAVGDAVARVTQVALDSGGVLAVHTADDHLTRELYRARPLITNRLKRLLGEDIVARFEIRTSSGTPAEERHSHARVGHRQRRASAHR